MAFDIPWAESFDQFGTNEELLTQGLWAQMDDGLVLTTEQVRTGVRSIRLMSSNNGMRRTLSGDFEGAGIACGFYMTRLPVRPTIGSSPGRTCIHQYRGPNGFAHVSLIITSTGRVEARRAGMVGALAGDGTFLGRSTLEMASGTWNHIESRVLISDTTGVVQVWVNGKEFLNLTDLDTRNNDEEAVVSQVAFGQFSSSVGFEYERVYWDDIAVSTFDEVDAPEQIGMMDAHYLGPVADEAPQDWLKTTGELAYVLIDEIPPDDDVDYIYSEVVNDQARFEIAPLPLGVVQVRAVMPIARVRKTDSGDADISVAVVANGVSAKGATVPITTSYTYYMASFLQDPETEDDWNPLALPSIQIEREL